MNENENELNFRQDSNEEPSYEFNTNLGNIVWSHTGFDDLCCIFNGFQIERLKEILVNPMAYNKEIRTLSRRVYNLNPIVSNAIDYIVALPCLSHILTSSGNNKKKIKENKQKVEKVLSDIQDKNIVRDFLFRDCIDGACYYYFDIPSQSTIDNKYLSGYDVETLMELNSFDISAAMTPLPVDYVKIIAYKNNRPLIAFNLEYFDQFDNNEKIRKLKCYPAEIREAHDKWKKGQIVGNWVVLDNTKTVVHKIKSDRREPYGRPITIAALIDIFYKDYLTGVKRSVLGEVNNKIIYQTLPEGEKGRCSLTKTQQENQHNTVKSAVMTKNNRGGTSFFTVAAGTKINTVNASVDILNEEIEPNLNSDIALGLGVALGLLDGKSGSYSSQQINLELLFSRIYQWVTEIADELSYVINQNIIKDKNNEIKIYYLPTSLVNRDKFVALNKELYMSGSGSKAAWITSCGWDLNAYLSLMDMEKSEKWDEKYTPHATSYNSSGDKDNSSVEEDKSGRPVVDNATNESTIATQDNDSNNQPKPSTA